MEQLLKNIYEVTEKGTDYQSYKDLKDACRECMKTDTQVAVKFLKKLSGRLECVIPTTSNLD